MGRGNRSSRRKERSRQTEMAAVRSTGSWSARLFFHASVFASLFLVGGCIAWAWMQSTRSTAVRHTAQKPSLSFEERIKLNRVKYEVEPQTLDELLVLTPEEREKVDIARMNLLCATDLPGAEDMDVDTILAHFDHWARRIEYETNRHLYRVTDPRYADHYNRNEARLRAEFVVQVLKEELGVRYNLARARDLDSSNSQDSFLHGFMAGGSGKANGGTCVSMPVLFAAIGRRLGYPIKLVTTRMHVFCRWEGLDHPNPAWRERFNIEGANEHVNYFEDEYYLNWPVKIRPEEVGPCRYLVSLNSEEELALFLCTRGYCLEDNGELREALTCYELAREYDPLDVQYKNLVVLTRQTLQRMTLAEVEARDQAHPWAVQAYGIEDIQRRNAENQARRERLIRPPTTDLPWERPGEHHNPFPAGPTPPAARPTFPGTPQQPGFPHPHVPNPNEFNYP